MTRRSTDRETFEAEIDRIRLLGLDELRALWRTTLRPSPQIAFTKDLIARFICWHIQEQAHGGVDANTVKFLDGLARGDKPKADRRLKPGTVLVREYQGDRHTITVVPGGYAWRDAPIMRGVAADASAQRRGAANGGGGPAGLPRPSAVTTSRSKALAGSTLQLSGLPD